MSLDPTKGERAVLVKGRDGDKFILVGKWTGHRRGIPGIDGNYKVFMIGIPMEGITFSVSQSINYKFV